MVYEIDAVDMKDMVKNHYDKKIPMMVYGGFGIGKSTILKASAVEIAKNKGKEFVDWNRTSATQRNKMFESPEKYFVFTDVRLSQSDNTDLKGLPRFDGEGDSVEWKIPKWINYLTNENADGIVFFDEINLAPPSVLASAYQILHDRCMGETKLSDKIGFFGAGNRCLTAQHFITMANPSREREKYKAISKILVGDKVISLGENGFEEDEVVDKWKRKVYNHPIYIVETENSQIQATVDHPLLTNKGWVYASNLKKGDVILEHPDSKKTKEVGTGRKLKLHKIKCAGCGEHFFSDKQMTTCSKSCSAKIVKNRTGIGHKQTKETGKKISKFQKEYRNRPEIKEKMARQTQERFANMSKEEKNEFSRKISYSLKNSKAHQDRMSKYFPKALMKWREENPELFLKSAQQGAITTRKKYAGKNQTNIEREIDNLIKKLNVNYEIEVPIYVKNKLVCIADFFIPSKNLVVMADGDYWHNFPDGTEKDLNVNKILKTNGFKVSRFWEKDIINKLDVVQQQLKLAITNGEVVKDIKVVKRTCFIYDFTTKKNHNFVANGLIVHNSQDRAHTFDMPNPLKDRMSEVELGFDTDKWFNWAYDNNIEPRIITFLQFKNTMVNKVSTKEGVKSITPRGWERTSTLIKGVKSSTLTHSLVASAIGEGVAVEFSAFLKLKNTVDLNEILKNPKIMKKYEAPDIRYAIVGGLAEKYYTDNKVFEKLIEVCEYIPADFGVLMLKMMAGHSKVAFKNSIMKNQKASGLLEKYFKFFYDEEGN